MGNREIENEEFRDGYSYGKNNAFRQPPEPLSEFYTLGLSVAGLEKVVKARKNSASNARLAVKSLGKIHFNYDGVLDAENLGKIAGIYSN